MRISKKETSHFQWPKLLVCFLMLLIHFITTLVRGKGDGSFIGVRRCDTIDKCMFSLLIVTGIFLTIVAIVMLNKEQTQKETIGYEFKPGDLICSANSFCTIITLATLVGFVVGLTDVSTDLILYPVLT